MAGSWQAWSGCLNICRRTIHFDRSMCSNCSKWPRQLLRCRASDGLWRPGLLDRRRLPAAGKFRLRFHHLRSGLWSQRRIFSIGSSYLPIVKKAWAGLLSHVYEDGRLGCIQPIGAAPGDFTVTSSYVYGVGAYLLAGSEIYKLANDELGCRLHSHECQSKHGSAAASRWPSRRCNACAAPGAG